MIRHGTSPFLECSSRGDKRFSAFCAILNGASIETQYQAAKVFEDGTTNLNWRQAKGKRAVNMKEVSALYSQLWDQYIEEHPELLEVLITQSGLSDMFGRPGCNCQATELWRIRNKALTSSPST